MNMKAKKHAFKAEVSEILDLVVHSLYWGEGDPLAQAAVIPEPTSRPSPASDQPRAAPDADTIDWLKTDTVLPHWLEGAFPICDSL